MTAELCPVCKGSGVVPDPVYGDQRTTSTLPITKTCHGCDGKGWVEVGSCSHYWPYYWPYQGPALSVYC